MYILQFSPPPRQCTDYLSFPTIFEPIRQFVGYKKAPGQDGLLPSNPAGLPPPSVREATLSVIAARCHLPRKGEVYCI